MRRTLLALTPLAAAMVRLLQCVASPDLYEYLEAEGVLYTIRLLPRVAWRPKGSINRECRSSFTDGAGSAIISAEFGSYLGNVGLKEPCVFW